MQQLERRMQEEEAAKQREKAIVGQRDQKIKIIEERFRQSQFENEVLLKRLEKYEGGQMNMYDDEQQRLVPVKAKAVGGNAAEKHHP